MKNRWLLFVGLLGMSCELSAQGVLPQGVFLYRFGYRGFSPQSEKYGNDGERISLGSSFNKDFNGQGLLKGNGGKELNRLAKELQRFDGQNRSSDSLVNQLDLGSLSGSVEAEINAKIFALGYGVTPRFTVYSGVPFVHARVSAEMHFSGSNNAAKIKKQLGGAAFQELQDGLDRASTLSIADIEQSIQEKGYAPIGEWERDGLGDVQVGGLYLLVNRRVGSGLFSLTADTGFSLPTGYVENPDILTDVSFGLGTYAVTQKFTPTMQWQYVSLGGEGFYTLGLPGQKSVRLPEDEETLTEADRKIEANYRPGGAYGVAVDGGLRWNWMKSNLRLGYRAKELDDYSGSLGGNYAQLSKETNSQQTYTEFGVGVDTTTLYTQQRFPVPFILNGLAHMPFAGKNSNDERYFEVSITSFFKIPGAGREVKLEKPRRTRAGSEKTADRN